MTTDTFNKNFRLNNESFDSVNQLLSYVRLHNSSIYSFLFQWFSSDVIEVQTSGSTGTPKVISLKKEYMQNSAYATGEFFNLKEDTTALLCLSTDYIAGKMMLVRALTLGWNLDLVPPNSKVEITKDYDFSAMVPMQLRNSLSEIEKIKKLIIGGGVVAKDLQEKIQNVSTNIFATYGMTETITHIAVKKLNNFSQLESSSATHYVSLPNVTIYRDQRNCLVIKASKISDELIVTNDVVQLISENQFEWLGRYDNVINSGGIKLHPEKIEEKLSKIIDARFFVTGIKDAVLGEKLILIIESDVISSAPTNSGEKSYKERVLALKSLSKYETPKAIYFVEKFIETETKKIQRKKTLDLLSL